MRKNLSKLNTFSNMGRRKVEDSNIRSLTKIAGGTSYAIVIPKEYIKKLKWRERQKLVLKLEGTQITIKDWEP